MDFPLKRASLITIIVIAALLSIFVPLWVKDDRRTDSLFSFAIPNLPAAPTPALLPMTSTKPNIKDLLNFPLTSAKVWVVELPDIKDPAQAENLVQTLRRKGFNAYSRQYKSLLGVLTRVFVGPEIKSEQIKHVAEQLKTQMHLTTQVVAFDPLLSQ